MNNFDPDIAAWRRQMSAGGVKNPAVLDELESHLREDIEQRIRAGADANRVFETASARLGHPRALKIEFDRVKENERNHMKRSLMIGAGIIGVMAGMAFVMPAVAQYRHEGAMTHDEPWLFLLGSLMTIAGCVAALRSLKKKSA